MQFNERGHNGGRGPALAFVGLFVVVLALAGCATNRPASEKVVSVTGTFASLTDQELAEKADIVLEGTVVANPKSEKGRAVSDAARAKMRAKGLSDEEITQMAESEAETIYTLALVRPSEVLKGKLAPGNVEVRVLGGEADGTTVSADDFPVFVKGERVLLFLGREYDGALGPLAVYRIDGAAAHSDDMGIRRDVDLKTLKDTIHSAASK